MSQTETAKAFAALHRPGTPLVLYNIWDAGSAKALADAEAPALATGSWSVAAAQGFADGEAIPLDLLLSIAALITGAVDVPVSIDFEGAYGVAVSEVADNTARLIETGAVGCNFEDQVVGSDQIHSADVQAERIAAMRGAANRAGVPFFINARTDLFLKEPDKTKHADLIGDAKYRAGVYSASGASGFFAPGLTDIDLIADLTGAVPLPVNVMAMPGAPDTDALAAAGVARISHGPFPYRKAMKDLAALYRKIA